MVSSTGSNLEVSPALGEGLALQPKLFRDFCLKSERSFVTFNQSQTPPLITAHIFSYGKDQPI